MKSPLLKEVIKRPLRPNKANIGYYDFEVVLLENITLNLVGTVGLCDYGLLIIV